MSKVHLIKNQVREILNEHKYHNSTEKWLENILVDLVYQIQENQAEREEKLEAMQKEMNSRFEAVQNQMDSRLETINSRFVALQTQLDSRFEASNIKFESLEKRLTKITWLIGIGFTTLAILIGYFDLFR